MEYLSLQDIPHRHYDSLHSRKMAPSHSSERPSGNMAAAVREHTSSSYPSSTGPLPDVLLHSAVHLPGPPASFHSRPHDRQSERAGALERYPIAPTLRHISLPSLSREQEAATVLQELARPFPPAHSDAHHGYRPSASAASIMPISLPFSRDSVHAQRHEGAREHIRDRERDSRALNSDLTDMQHYHMRSSPPIQPGEPSHDKLPSFSEFLHTTRASTPPRTPSRRNGSADSSPRAGPHFEDVGWAESKRRRIDTLGDIYSHPPVASEQVDSRRMSSAIDPALSAYGSPRLSHQAMVPNHHHRPSHSYPPPSHASVHSGAHVRHQSTSIPPGHSVYPQQPPHQSMAGHGGYQAPMTHQGPIYEQRATYYAEPQPAVYGYDRSHDAYFNRPPYSNYDGSYGDIRFQQHVGLDQNTFNRKRRGNLPKEATNLLKEWFTANRGSPYPSEEQKMDLCGRTGLSINQVSNWFINARRRAPQKEQRERDANNSEA